MTITDEDLNSLMKMTAQERHEYFKEHDAEINFYHLKNRCRQIEKMTHKNNRRKMMKDPLEDVVESAIVFNWIKNFGTQPANQFTN